MSLAACEELARIMARDSLTQPVRYLLQAAPARPFAVHCGSLSKILRRWPILAPAPPSSPQDLRAGHLGAHCALPDFSAPIRLSSTGLVALQRRLYSRQPCAASGMMHSPSSALVKLPLPLMLLGTSCPSCSLGDRRCACIASTAAPAQGKFVSVPPA